VRFVKLTGEQRRALRTLAVLAVESRARSNDAEDKSRSPGVKFNGRVIMSACLKVIERRLPNMVWTLRTELVKRLRAMGAGESHEVGNSARSDADQIEAKASAIARTVERRVIRTFAEVGGLDDTQQLVLAHLKRPGAGVKAAAGEKLGLVKDKALESSVAMNATCQRFETELAGRSFDVNVRLANVLGRRIDEIENPLVPAVMCRMLWQSVIEYCESPRMHTCLHSTLVRDIMPLISELYDQLDETLDAQGVPDSYWMGGDT